MTGKLGGWLALPRPAWLYLAHAALLTGSLAVTGLLWNLAVLAMGYPRSFLGVLTIAGVAAAGLLALPMWWLVARAGLRRALMLSAALQASGAALVALQPSEAALLVAAGVTGAAAVLFQISAAPYMMRHSDASTRDYLFSANAAVNVGVAGAGSLLAGQFPGLAAAVLGAPSGDEQAYRASFAVAAAGLLLALAPLALIGEPRAQAARPRGAGLRGALAAVRAGGLAAAWPVVQLLIPPALISAGAALLVPYLNLFFRERFALADGALGALFAALGLATGLAALAAPLLSSRLGKAGAIVLAQGLSIPLLLAVGFAPGVELAVAAAIARGALFNMGSPLYDALAMERTPEPARPAVIGLVNAAYASGYLVAPAVSVAVQERWGFAPLFAATAACYTLAVLAVFWFFARRAPAGLPLPEAP